MSRLQRTIIVSATLLQAAGSSRNLSGKCANIAHLTEAEHCAAALETRPANVRRFFEAEEPVVSPRQSESAQDRLEREARASFGGWPGG